MSITVFTALNYDDSELIILVAVHVQLYIRQ